MPSGAGGIPSRGPEGDAHLSGPVSRGGGSARELGGREVWIRGGIGREKGKKELGRQGDRNRIVKMK